MPHLLKTEINATILDDRAFLCLSKFLAEVELLNKRENDEYVASLIGDDSDPTQNKTNKPTEITHQFLHGVDFSRMLDKFSLDKEICTKE